MAETTSAPTTTVQESLAAAMTLTNRAAYLQGQALGHACQSHQRAVSDLMAAASSLESAASDLRRAAGRLLDGVEHNGTPDGGEGGR